MAGSGALDTSYGQGGVAIADFGTFGAVVDNAQGNALVVQADGKVIVVGTGIDQFGQTSDIVTARFTAGGALDPSWGAKANGKAQFDFGQSETGYGAVLQPDGKLIIGGDTVGTTGTSDVLAVRVATDGSLDGTFGVQGRAHPDFGQQEFGRAIALRPDGKIVIAGYDPGGSLIVRLSNAGAPDTSFDQRGASGQGTFAGPPSAAAVGLAHDGTTDFAGTLHNTITDTYNLMYGNALDSGGNSVGAVDPAESSYGTAIAELPDGSRLLAGFTSAGGADDFVLIRLASDMSFDSSFGTGGKVDTDLGGTDDAHAMVVQPDGKIVVVGTSTLASVSRIGVVRFLANGQRDPAFGTNGIEIVSIAGAKLAGNAVGLQANGDIIVGGTITPAGSTRKQLLAIRLHGDATGSTSAGGGTGGTGGGGTGGTGTGGTGGAGGTGGGGAGGSTSTLTCQGHKATIVGTAKADKIKGTSHADVIVSLGGNDVIDGGGGNDIICAGAGNDHISGGAGNDRIYGQDGADTVSGGAGNDTLDGGSGDDHLSGGAGSDSLMGDAGKDTLAGGAGSDHLSGGAGNDTLTGGSGKDTLTGGAGQNHDSQ
ncbi:MAG TPA: hypothetical protein VGF46_05335 [Gaiellales bacterium]